MSSTSAPQEERVNGQDKVPAVTKAMAIVRYVNRAQAGGAGLNDIANDLDVTKSHCHNILKTLTHEGWLTYDSTAASTRLRRACWRTSLA